MHSSSRIWISLFIVALSCVVILLFVLVWPSATPSGEPLGSLQMPKQLEDAQIDDRAGVNVPFDVGMTDQDGNAVKLGDYFSTSDKRPVILTLGYYGCPMLCSLVLNGLVEGLRSVSFKIGKDYRILSASIDDREKPDLAKRKQAGYLESLGASDPSAWKFHVMAAVDAKRLADAVGFRYSYDKTNDQFAHGAGFFVLSPTGVLSRTLFGISYKPSDIKLALSEASDGKIGSFVDRVLLSCFHYDPDSHRYGVYVFGVMRLGGILTIVILGLVLLMYFRGERKRIKSIV